MRSVLRALLLVAVGLGVRDVEASCLSKSFSTLSGQYGYFYVVDHASAASTHDSIVGRFWSPGAYATTGEQECDETYWLMECPGCGGATQGHGWYIDGTLGQMGCTSGCPSSQMIVTLEDKSSDGADAFFAAARVDETPFGNVTFDFARVGRNIGVVRMPAPQIVDSGIGDVATVRFYLNDPAPGFYGLAGVPASSTITAFWLYTRSSPGERSRAAWTFAGRVPYSGGGTQGQVTLVCDAYHHPYLAAAIEFDSGQVVTDYLSAGTYVDCDPYQPGAGAVRDGGADGLFAKREADGNLTLSWGRSCSPLDQGYEVYEGSLGDWASHRPVTCSNSGALTATFAPAAYDAYYLVVPFEDSYEGSYGKASGGVERPLGAGVCRTRLINACPP